MLSEQGHPEVMSPGSGVRFKWASSCCMWVRGHACACHDLMWSSVALRAYYCVLVGSHWSWSNIVIEYPTDEHVI